jgi:solute carrier family 25 oxoglutarate transporter 11
MRLGIYFNLTEHLKRQKGDNLSLGVKTTCSLIAGSIGSFVGNPCDLVLVRMQADKRLIESERRNYGNVFNAFRIIVKEEGIPKLWTGGMITMARACAMNVCMLVSYDESKERLRKSMKKASDREI